MLSTMWAVVGVGGTMRLRLNRSFLAHNEQKIIAVLLANMPQTVSPMHLTVVGIVGAVICSVSLIGCNHSAAFLPLVFVGLFINWFGDSLDGSLARFRHIERPRYGFLVDHSSDLIAQTVILTGFGFSPYFTMTSALVVLVMYLLFSAFTYIRVVVDRVHHLTYGRLGATEFRIMMAVWVFVAHVAGPSMVLPRIGAYSSLDVVIGVLAIGAFGVFLWSLRQHAAQIEAEEGAGVVVLFEHQERAARNWR
jgi:archaetidylinositol phosphate synthase